MKQNKKYRLISSLLIIIILTVILLGCNDSSTEPTSNESGLIIKVTDNPFPIDLVAEANVTINKIELRSSNSSEANSFIVVLDSLVEYNLVELRNGLTKDLPKINIPTGKYNLIRLYVEKAEVLLKTGEVFNLNIPSGASTGIKVFINPEIEIVEGITSELLIDFDLSKSFIVQGNQSSSGIKGFTFKPVLRAVNNTETGSISGFVSNSNDDKIVNAQIWAEQDSVVSMTFSDSTGSYSLIGLQMGIYKLKAYKEGYDTVTTSGVNVSSGEDTKINVNL